VGQRPLSHSQLLTKHHFWSAYEQRQEDTQYGKGLGQQVEQEDAVIEGPARVTLNIRVYYLRNLYFLFESLIYLGELALYLA